MAPGVEAERKLQLEDIDKYNAGILLLVLVVTELVSANGLPLTRKWWILMKRLLLDKIDECSVRIPGFQHNLEVRTNVSNVYQQSNNNKSMHKSFFFYFFAGCSALMSRDLYLNLQHHLRTPSEVRSVFNHE